MKEMLKKSLSKNLERIAKVSADSASLICFYEPKVPDSLKTQDKDTDLRRKGQ